MLVIAERQLPDTAHVLAQSAEWRQLQRRRRKRRSTAFNRCRTCRIFRCLGRHRRAREILGDVSSISRGSGLAVVSHYNLRRVVDIFGSVDGRDLGAVARRHQAHCGRQPQIAAARFSIAIRGQIEP